MEKQPMNLDEIAEIAQWYAETYDATEFMAFGPGGHARAHVTCGGLREVAPVEDWGWKNRWPGEIRPDDQWSAYVHHSGVLFYALFSESEKRGALKDANPMLPDPAALAGHEPTSGIEDSRGAAGLPGGDSLLRGSDALLAELDQLLEQPFKPHIRSLVDADHDMEACTIEDCPTCTILETRELLHPVEL